MLYRVNFIAVHATERVDVVNTLHVNASVKPFYQLVADPTPKEVADEIYTQLGVLWRACLATTYNFDRVSVSTVVDPNDPEQVPETGEHTVSLAGTRPVADSDLPPTVCGLISLRTGKAGRSFRGRMFMPPIENKSALQNNLINATDAYDDNLEVFRGKLDDALGGGSTWSTLWMSTWSMKVVVYSPTRHGRALTPFYSDVKATKYDRSVHWLRSRRK